MEKVLVERCCAGNQQAWSELINTYLPTIQASIKSAYRNFHTEASPHEVDDICQEVFFKLLKNNASTLRNFKWKSSLKTWLVVVASSCAVDNLRKRHRRHSQLSQDAQNWIQDASPELDDEEPDIYILKEAMEKLLPRDRLLLQLSYERKWSYEKIGGLVGISVNAVGPAISRAVKRLENAFYEIKRAGARE